MRGNTIKSIRELRGLSRRKLASMIGIPTRKLKAAETGVYVKPLERRKMKMRYIEFLGYAVRIPVDYPVDGEPVDVNALQQDILMYLGESY